MIKPWKGPLPQQHCNRTVTVVACLPQRKPAHPHVLSTTHSARLGRQRNASPQPQRRLSGTTPDRESGGGHQSGGGRPMGSPVQVTSDQARALPGRAGRAPSSRALVWCRPASRALRRGNAIGAACTAPATGDDSCIRTPHRQPATSPSSQPRAGGRGASTRGANNRHAPGAGPALRSPTPAAPPTVRLRELAPAVEAASLYAQHLGGRRATGLLLSWL